MKVVILWLINERGELLLSQRAAHINSDPGMWGPSVSGKIEPGEAPEQAAVREMQEELGVDPSHISPLSFLHDSTHSHADGRLREFSLFSAQVAASHIDMMKLEPNEVAAIKWIPLAELQKVHASRPETILIGTDKQLWAEIFDNLGGAVGNLFSAR